MQKEITKYYCDCCGSELTTQLVYRNDDTHQDTFIRMYDKDLCHMCAARVLKNLYDKIEKEDFESSLEYVRDHTFGVHSLTPFH